MMDITNTVNHATSTLQAHQTRQSLDALQGEIQGSDRTKALEAAKKFESMFITQMLGQMFNGIESDGYFGGGSQEKMFQSFMVEEYGNLMTERGGIGLSDEIHRQMIMMQEGS